MRMICLGISLILSSFAFAQNQPPVAVIKVVGKTIANNQIQVNSGEQVQFLASDSKDPEGRPLTYLWNFGDNQTSTLVAPKHTYANSGTYTVTLTADDGVIIPPPHGPNPAYPNEPAGFNRIMEENFSVMIPNTSAAAVCAGPGILAGCWAHYPFDSPTMHSIVNDGTAPKSPGGVFQFKYSAGIPCGVGPGKFYASVTPAQAEMKEIYESNWFKIPSADFENQARQMKLLGYWGVGANKPDVGNQVFTIVTSTTDIASSFRMEMSFQGAIGARRLYPNSGVGGSFNTGTWHRFEIYMKLNDINLVKPGSDCGLAATYCSNGILIVWIDGVMTHYYTDCLFVRPEAPRGFFERHWAPIYGGTCPAGTVKTRDDYLWVDHLYMSGIPK